MHRFFEILPGALAWLTLVSIILFSWRLPIFASVFIILFDVYWLLKTVYLSLHLRSTFSAMKKNLKIDWLLKLKEFNRDANDANAMRIPRIVEKELSYKLNGILFRVHNGLGRFCRERQYGDAFARELQKENIKFRRESPIAIADRKSNFVDFIVEDKVAVELKAKYFTDKEDYYQLQRYLQVANLKLGFIVNFRDRHLKPRRVLNSRIETERLSSFVDSDVFADSHREISWRDIYHLIILPMYREPYEVVRESFQSLINANYPKDKFIVALATEERAGGAAKETAKKIEREFGAAFFKFLITAHPAGLPGEIPGKGSNETWAVREAKRLIIDPLIRDANDANTMRMTRIKEKNSQNSDVFADSDVFVDSHRVSYENILVSVFDIDTQIFPDYFGRLTHVFLDAPNRLRAIYQPVPLFTNNIYQAPALARVIAFSSTFWQMMQQARVERLTSFSSQSLPFPILLDIGFWHTDAVSEDSRIFWQGYLRYHSDFRVEPLLYPVSMDANVAPGFWQTMKNNYRQHRRWAWGCENIPYMLCGKIEAKKRESNRESMRKKIREISRADSHSFASQEGFLYDKKIPLRKKWYWSFNVIEGFHSWATNSLMIFALGWLPVLIGGKHFNASLLSYSLPQITRLIIQLSMLGVASSAIVSILLLPPRPQWFRWHHYFLYFLQWLFIPLTLIVFGAFPALEAQTRLMLGGKWRLGFWATPKSRSKNNEV